MANSNKQSRSSGEGGALLGAAAAGLAIGLVANFARKAAMQGISATAGEWDDILKAEHQAVIKLFDLVEATEDTQVAKRKALLMKIKYALVKHSAQEEHVVYPSLHEHGMGNEAEELSRDHGHVKHFLFELSELEPNNALWMAKIREFRSELEEHIQEEEDELFPRLRDGLGMQGNQHITKLMNKEGMMAA